MTEEINTAIELLNLTKAYGEKRGITNVTLRVPSGQVFGLLGPNGAGKTTTIRLIMDIIRPTKGRAKVLGFDSQVDRHKIRKDIGYLPGEVFLPEHLTGWEVIDHFSRSRKLTDMRETHMLIERFDIDMFTPVSDLSKGNKQKIGILQAFMHRPRLLVLDEPTSGLDPLLQREFYQLTQEICAAGHTVLMTSHRLEEIQEVAQMVGILREGTAILTSSIEAFRLQTKQKVEIQFREPIKPEHFSGLDNIENININNKTLLCTVTGTIDPLIKRAACFSIETIATSVPRLEEVLLQYFRS